MPKVSVIIPNYNHAAYLEQRLESVLNQTYTDYEVIILDDCSTDNSRCMIEQYGNDKRISHIVYNETNTGNPFEQWDKGINLATGEYIWIAESDDWCELNFLENLINGLSGNENCVLAYCQSFCVTNNGNIKFQSAHPKLKEYVEGATFISKYMVSDTAIFNASMAVWKKNVYQKISKEYINYKRIGDYVFWIEIANCGDVFISGRLLNYFRSHENNVSKNALQSGLSFIDHIPLFKKLLERNLIDQKDYSLAMMKTYNQFRLSKKELSIETRNLIQNLFKKYGKPMIKLKTYFYFKNLQIFSRRLLRI